MLYCKFTLYLWLLLFLCINCPFYKCVIFLQLYFYLSTFFVSFWHCVNLPGVESLCVLVLCHVWVEYPIQVVSEEMKDLEKEMKVFEAEDKLIADTLERRRLSHQERKRQRQQSSPKQEPSSTVQSPLAVPDLPSPTPVPRKKHAPSAWKGFVDVPEVCKFFTTAHGVHGNSDCLKSVSYTLSCLFLTIFFTSKLYLEKICLYFIVVLYKNKYLLLCATLKEQIKYILHK